MRLHTAAVALALTGSLLLGGCAMRCFKPYFIGRGESIGDVAARYGIPESELRRDNRIGEDVTVAPGDRIFLPCDAEELPSSDRIASSPPDSNVSAPAAASATPPAPRRGQVTEEEITPPPRRNGAAAGTPTGIKPAGAPKFSWPVEGEVVRGFSDGRDAAAKGIDIRTGPASEVRAAAGGRVEYAGTPATAYGPMVLLAHPSGYYTVYSHMGSIKVATGDKVEGGGVLGVAGTDKYVHFEVRQGRKAVDPLLFLPRR